MLEFKTESEEVAELKVKLSKAVFERDLAIERFKFFIKIIRGDYSDAALAEENRKLKFSVASWSKAFHEVKAELDQLKKKD